MPRIVPAAVVAIASAAVGLAATGSAQARVLDSTVPAVTAQPQPPVSAPADVPAASPPSPAAVAQPENRVELEGGGFDLPVGLYADCSRVTEVGHDGAYVDACIPRPLAYFIGHNPGPFTALATVPVGAVVDYYDGAGGLHRLRVVSAREWNRFWGPPPLTQSDVVAQFQTCLTLDAVWDRILDAVEIPAPPPVVVPDPGVY